MMSETRLESQVTSESNQKPGIDWGQVCRLVIEQSLPVNSLTTRPNDTEIKGQEINLSVGLVERERGKARRGKNLWLKNEFEPPIVRKYSEKQFFEQIIGQGNSNTNCRRIGIIGKSGAGKTTLLYKIADWMLKNTNDVPIWISLADIGQTPLRQYLKEKWLKRAAQNSDLPLSEWEKSLDELHHNGRLWLLLDGVDEMPIEQITKVSITIGTTETQPRIFNALSAISEQIQGWAEPARIILTSRDYVWAVEPNFLPNFDIFSPLELSYPDEVKQFISNWLTQNNLDDQSRILPRSDTELTQKIYHNLENFGQARLLPLVQTVLRFSLFCRFCQQKNGILPKSQAQISQQIIGEFYQWQAEKVKTTPQQQKELNRALGNLAISAVRSKLHPRWIPESLVQGVFGHNPSLFNLAKRLGWLKIIGITTDHLRENIYAFFDYEFQQYFASLAVNDWRFFLNKKTALSSDNQENFPQISCRIFSYYWQRVILFWFGREDIKQEEKESFIKALIEFDDGCDANNFYGKRAYFFAASALAEFEECTQTDEIINQLLTWSFSSVDGSPLIAEMAKAALLETNQSRAISLLMERLLTIDDAKTQGEMLRFLVKIGQNKPEAIALLTEILDTTESDSLRWQVAETLGKIDVANTKALATVINLLENTTNEEVRKIGFNILEKIGKGNSKAISALIRILHTNQAIVSQTQVLETLGKIGHSNPTAIAALVQLIRTTQSQLIRRQAAESLEKVDPGNPTAVAVLIKFAQDATQKEIQQQAIYSLGEITPGNEEAIATLVELLDGNHDFYIRWMAVSSLGKIGTGNQQAIEALVKLIRSDEPIVLRKDAIESLGKIAPNHPQAISALVKLSEFTRDESTRQEAAESLGKIDPGNPDAITALLKLLRDSEDDFTRRQAASSLGKIAPGNLESLKTLINLVHSSSDQDIRSLAAESLGDIGSNNPAAAAALVRLIKTKTDSKTWRRAAESLGKIGIANREVISALVTILGSSQDESAALQAADSLVLLLKTEQMPEVVTHLKEALSGRKKENDLAFQKVLFHLAHNLSYHEFYRAWHSQKLEKPAKQINPKIREQDKITITDTLPDLGNDNFLDNLQENLRKNTKLTDSVHLIYINSNDLIDADNPAIDIYDLMLNQKCPEFFHGIPDNMSSLRLYWNTIRRDYPSKRFIMIFHEKLSSTDSQGFSSVFIKNICKFPGAICFITEKEDLKLKQFYPKDPDLVEKIIDWMERMF